MKKALWVSFIVLFFTSLYSQSGLPVDVNNIKQKLIQEQFMENLNAHRKELKLPLISVDSVLTNAATIQADYMCGIGKITHKNNQVPFSTSEK